MRFPLYVLGLAPLSLLTTASPTPQLLTDPVTQLLTNLQAFLAGTTTAIDNYLSAGNFNAIIETLRGVSPMPGQQSPATPQDAIAQLQALYTNGQSPANLFDYVANLRALNLIDSIDSLLDYVNGLGDARNSMNNVNRDPPSPIYPFKCSCDAPYSVPEVSLRGAIYIPPNFTYGRIPPVILFPGTGATGYTTFAGNYIPLLQGSDFADPVWVNVPGYLLDDAQTNAEYAAYAISYISAITQSNVTVVAWSQGNIDTQWAYKYWPCTRQVTSDHVAISADYDGTIAANLINGPSVPLPPSLLQQRYLASSNFITTLQTYNGDSAYVPTTSIFSGLFDEIVQPQTGTGASAFILDARGVGASNTEVQVTCALQPAGTFYTHEGVLYNPLGFALFRDAMANPGPGQVSRLNVPSVCATYLTPGLNVADFLTTENSVAIALLAIGVYTPKTTVEPPIKQYALQPPVSDLSQCTPVASSTTTTTTTSSMTSVTTTSTTTSSSLSTTSSSASITSTTSSTSTISGTTSSSTTSSSSSAFTTSSSSSASTTSSTTSAPTTSSTTTPTTSSTTSAPTTSSTTSAPTTSSTTSAPTTSSTTSASTTSSTTSTYTTSSISSASVSSSPSTTYSTITMSPSNTLSTSTTSSVSSTSSSTTVLSSTTSVVSTSSSSTMSLSTTRSTSSYPSSSVSTTSAAILTSLTSASAAASTTTVTISSTISGVSTSLSSSSNLFLTSTTASTSTTSTMVTTSTYSLTTTPNNPSSAISSSASTSYSSSSLVSSTSSNSSYGWLYWTTTETTTSTASEKTQTTFLQPTWSVWTSESNTHDTQATRAASSEYEWNQWASATTSTRLVVSTTSKPANWSEWQTMATSSIKSESGTTSVPESTWAEWSISSVAHATATVSRVNGPDTTVTVITTSYTNVCPTGYTVVPFTTTMIMTLSPATSAQQSSATLTHEVASTGVWTWPTGPSGIPTGWIKTTTLCSSGCASNGPTTVTLTVPTAAILTQTVVPVQPTASVETIQSSQLSYETAKTSTSEPGAWSGSASRSSITGAVATATVSSPTANAAGTSAPSASATIKPFTGAADAVRIPEHALISVAFLLGIGMLIL